jgi:hypothetical protein
MTHAFRFKMTSKNGQKTIFEQNNLARYAQSLPYRNVTVYDTTTNKPVGRMKLGSALEKFG